MVNRVTKKRLIQIFSIWAMEGTVDCKKDRGYCPYSLLPLLVVRQRVLEPPDGIIKVSDNRPNVIRPRSAWKRERFQSHHPHITFPFELQPLHAVSRFRQGRIE